MKYKGIYLLDTSHTPRSIVPPRDMLVWDDGSTALDEPVIRKVLAIVDSKLLNGRVICETEDSFVRYGHCAEIPTPRRATWKELAYWLVDGKGLVVDENTSRVDTGVIFKKADLDEKVSDFLKVMRRDDTEFHEPTIDYMEIEEVR